MAIDSCDHNEYVVVYDTQASLACPVCELEEDIKDLKSQIDELESQQD